MNPLETFATKLPGDLKKTLDEVSVKLGLKKNYIIETALREKLEDLIDAHDLQEAVREATGFHDWGSIKKETELVKKKKSA